MKRLEKTFQAGESETVEFNKSTAQLPRAGETLCGFLKGDGGMVVIGVGSEGQPTGQQVADMLYGTRFLPDYPQGRLKLGRTTDAGRRVLEEGDK